MKTQKKHIKVWEPKTGIFLRHCFFDKKTRKQKIVQVHRVAEKNRRLWDALFILRKRYVKQSVSLFNESLRVFLCKLCKLKRICCQISMKFGVHTMSNTNFILFKMQNVLSIFCLRHICCFRFHMDLIFLVDHKQVEAPQ